MYKCKICNNKVLLIKGLYICTQCEKELKKNQFYKDKTEQLNNSSYPNIIMNEYSRIFDLLQNKQIYGALLQTKDSYELIIKIIILAIQSELYGDNQELEKNSDIIFKLFEKPLSLGDWEKIGIKLKSKSKYKELDIILNDILNIYNKNKITNWRNNWIGHGALALETNEEFKEELYEKIEALKKHLIKNEENYKRLNIFKEKEKIKLMVGEGKICFAPFVIEKNKEIYLFDSYNRYAEEVIYLNYHNADKIQIKSNEFKNLINKIQFNNNKMTFKSKLNDNIYTSIEERIIKDISNIKDFERPDFIIKEIDKFLNENDKGVLLLKMEEGMGKSTLSMALDQNSIGKIKLNNSIVKAYYINDLYGSKIENFVTAINDIFRTDKDGKIVYKGNIPTVSINRETFKNELINLLEFYRDIYKKDYNSDKLIFIIDGLDEIVNQDNGNLFEYLPGKDDIGDNIYIIYTSRTDDELDEYYFLKNNIHKIKITREISITKENNNYLNFINKYLKNNYRNISSNMYSSLVNKATKKIKNLRRIGNILENNLLDIKQIPDDELYRLEIDRMHAKFGDKYFKIIKDIILLICQDKNGLTVSEISKLIFNDNVNFEIYFYLMNLSEILEVNRTLKGNRIKINDYKLSEFMMKENQNNLVNIYDKLLNKILIHNSNILIEYDNLDETNSYIYSNICKILKGSSKYNIQDLCLDINLGYLIRIVDNIPKSDIESILLRNNINMQILELINYIYKKEELYYLIKAIVKSNEAEVYDLLGDTSKSLIKFNESIEEIKQIDIKKYIFLSNVIIKIYIKKGILLTRVRENLDAINCFDYAESLFELIQTIEKNSNKLINLYLDYEDYISILINRGSVYYNDEKYNLALSDFNKAIDSLNDYYKGHSKNLQLSMAYLNRGSTYIKLGYEFIKKSLEDYNNALETCDINSIEGKINYCTILQSLNNIELINNKSLNEYKTDKLLNAIRILESLYEQNELVDLNILFTTYLNMIEILRLKGKQNLAIKYIKQLDIIFRKAEDNKTFIDKSIYINIVALISGCYNINIKKEKDRLINYYEKVIMSFDYKKTNKNLFNRTICHIFHDYVGMTILNNYQNWNIINYFINNIKIIKLILSEEQKKLIIETFYGILVTLCNQKNEVYDIDNIVEFILEIFEIYNNNCLKSIKFEVLKIYGDYLADHNEIEKGLKQYDEALTFYNLLEFKEQNEIDKNNLLMLYTSKAVLLYRQEKLLDSYGTIQKGIDLIHKYGVDEKYITKLNEKAILDCIGFYMKIGCAVEKMKCCDYYEV